MRSLLVAMMLLTAVSSVLAGQRVALVIGNNNYQNLSVLKNPVLDAKRLAGVLASNGFDVMSCDGENSGCFNLTRASLIDALELFRRKSKGADVALVFYAGHGMQTKAQGNIIAPIDIEMSCEVDDPFRSVVLDAVLKSVSGAKEKIVILDACRNDPLKTMQCTADRGAKPLAFGSISVSEAERKFLLMTSTLNGQFARDGLPGTHSPFAEALFHYLEREPAIHFDQLLDRVAIRVEARARDQGFIQVPEILTRGGAPKTCLSGYNCSGDPEAANLRLEVETLRKENARGGEFQEIVQVMVRESGYSSLDEIPAEERKSLFKGIVEASQALVQRDDNKGDQALAALKEGNEDVAIRLFEEDIARRLASAADENREAAASARHIASLARPTDVARASEFYAQASKLDPDDLQTWMDLGSTMRDSGNWRQSVLAFKSGIEVASTTGERIWEARFNNGLGRTAYLTGNEPLLAAQRYHQRAVELASEHLVHGQSDEARQALLSGHYRLCDVKVRLGDAEGAEATCRSAVSLASVMMEAQPDDSHWQEELHNSHIKMGDVQKVRGNLPAALRSYLDSHAIVTRLAASDPSNTRWQSSLAIANNRVGNVQVTLGKLPAALAIFEISLAIWEQLAASDPNNTVWKRGLLVTHNKIGGVRHKQGDLDEAEISHERSLAVAQQLAANDPDNAGWQQDLSVSYNRLGDIQVEQGKLATAMSSYQASLAIAERLAASDPDDAGWQWNLYVAYERLADNTNRKEEYLGKALGLLERLYAEGRLAPDRLQWIKITKDRLAEVRERK